LLRVADRHQPWQVTGYFYAVAVLTAVAALTPLSAGQADLSIPRASPMHWRYVKLSAACDMLYHGTANAEPVPFAAFRAAVTAIHADF
jgi:hypothetical protein